jgi:hypothetical protein
MPKVKIHLGANVNDRNSKTPHDNGSSSLCGSSKSEMTDGSGSSTEVVVSAAAAATADLLRLYALSSLALCIHAPSYHQPAPSITGKSLTSLGRFFFAHVCSSARCSSIRLSSACRPARSNTGVPGRNSTVVGKSSGATYPIPANEVKNTITHLPIKYCFSGSRKRGRLTK